jgi:hypothetical protein
MDAGGVTAADWTADLRRAVEGFSVTDDPVLEPLAQRLGALGALARSAPRRAAVLVALAWGAPLALAALAGAAWGPFETRPFLTDLGAFCRFALAVAVLATMDATVDAKLRAHLRHLADSPLLAPASIPSTAAAIVRAVDRARSPMAGAVCLMFAAILALAGAVGALDQAEPSWITAIGADGARLTAAGMWAACVSSPIVGFLLLRWLWRHLVWALLLRDLSRMEMRLVATHPDGAGGLGFIGQYPNVFAALVFAMSAILAAAIVRALAGESLGVEAYGWIMTGWLVVVVGLFAAPLAFFSSPLRRLKEETSLAAAARATSHFRAAEREVLGANVAAPGDAPERDGAPPLHPSKLYAAAAKLKTLPFSRSAILPLGAAALLPLLLAGATRLPVKELWKVASKLLLL